MQIIVDHVAIEKFSGVVVGAISTQRGLIYIDAPFILDEMRTWRASLMRFSSGMERLIIALDMNPDRMLGIRNMDAPLLVHQVAQAELDGHAITYKQDEKKGLYIERYPLFGSYRWPQVAMGFDEHLELHWDDEGPITLTYSPGVRPDAIWVAMPARKVIFIGDAVVHHEPPFIADATIPLWIETLNRLLQNDYRGYKIISGRDGLITRREVHSQIARLERMQMALQSLGADITEDEPFYQLAEKMLRYYAPRDDNERSWYLLRLGYGLKHYYMRHGG